MANATQNNLDQNFIELVKTNYPKNANKILKAYEFADAAHSGVKRKSGEPYIIHPVEVAKILIGINMDYLTIIAALLHDVVEDTEYTLDDIQKLFGKTAATLVDGVTKIGDLSHKNLSTNEADSIKKLLFAMGDDVRVIFIKLADRLHNMRTVKFLKPDKQIRMAEETRDLFIPIAYRMGVRSIRAELEDLVAECLYTDEYNKIQEVFGKKYKKIGAKVEKLKVKISNSLAEFGISSTIDTWTERYFSILKKVHSAGNGTGKASGLILVKIIVPTTEDCYKALGILHSQFDHLPNQIKDYIASPKPNGYKSLHSTLVEHNLNLTFQVMIRTAEMDSVCDQGIVSLWANKDDDIKFDERFEKFNRMKNIVLSERKQITNTENFIDAVKTDLSQDSIWVFTPKFKPIHLNSSSPTPIDFAYAVHTDLGNNAVGAKINGQKASLAAKLKAGDVVEIVVSEVPKAPSRDWLNVATTSVARKRIHEYLNKNLTPENTENGRNMLKVELEKNGHNLGEIFEYTDQIIEDFGFKDVNDMFANIGYKSITVMQIAKYVLDAEVSTKILSEAPVIVEGSSKIKSLTFAKCCAPIPHDKIVGVVSNSGLIIHTQNCQNIKKIAAGKLLKATWKDNINQMFKVNVKIIANDGIGIGAKVLGEISKHKFYLTKLEAKLAGVKNCEFVLTVMVSGNEEFEKLKTMLETIEDVKSVYRIFE
ncbi:MAG: bifunctional (p)ppGpp synthetase/guanosine-3',5'-bis(diphosphate) 3'-pyrophosphohydrolase [Clostridia bacterium]|nr:bifunctional (p)ppGpp synthetase/guanosine-3',5'-bis(diphosphate) 3'-pyrophosphohydrolase [Clostridia bacterium]